jgi:hypothetical protein
MHRILYENPNNGAVYQGLAWDTYGIYSFPQHKPYRYMRIVHRDYNKNEIKKESESDSDETKDDDLDEIEESPSRKTTMACKHLHASYFPPRYHHLVPMICLKRGYYEPKTVSPNWLDWAICDLKNEMGWKQKGEFLAANDVCFVLFIYYLSILATSCCCWKGKYRNKY